MAVSCHENKHPVQTEGKKRVLLMGNPNVGKSVIFSTLTKKRVITANYSGTTVTAMKGDLVQAKPEAVLIDVPGIYSLKPVSKAEEAAMTMLNEGADVIVCVLDATNLERNLQLALELKRKDTPVIFLLNMMDVAEKKGIQIDDKKLSSLLQAPVIPTVAVKRKGFNRLIAEINKVISGREHGKQAPLTGAMPPVLIGEEVQTYIEYEERLIDKWERWTIQPITGLPIAILAVLLALAFVVGAGKAVRSVFFLPLLNNYYIPFMERLAGNWTTEGTALYSILVGEFGVLIKAVEWPIALILPYVFLFYIVLSFLEDSGYLPRLGILIDGLLRRFGLHGHSIIPISMGYGCAVPAIIGTRAASSLKERLIISALVSLAVPCIAQTGAFIALLGDHSFVLLLAVFLVSFLVMFISGSVLNKFLKGTLDPVLIEVPNLLVPSASALWKKVMLRTKHFMIEAEIPMVFGILFAALTIETGVLTHVSFILEPLVVSFLGLPPEASVALILGIVRRELAVLPLLGMDLSLAQMFVGSVVALLYIPCMSVFFVLIKEFRIKWALSISAATIILAFVVGGMANYLIHFFQWMTMGGGF
ncbi:ferrous iron transport protein B [Salipaludibacillus aurantiacus]|uniref:Ferrous iron transport protein B n=1 Tax=Salipaludibacillus aurantiacus TaxID=1601833 RepID=A0A1H9SAW0_9BACI|nr:ferrous iron transport protein B [Salipaludibacillus aurantiacus]